MRINTEFKICVLLLHPMQDFFIHLPPAALAALIASLVTLFGGVFSAAIGLWGVTRTNRAHEKRLHAQFEKDDTRKRIEREMDLRKCVYMEVAEAIQAGLIIIGRYSDTNISQQELLVEFNSKRYGFAKANLIARPALLDALMKFNTEFSANILALSVNRQNLINIKEQLSRVSAEISKHIGDREAALSNVKSAQFNGNQHPSQIDALNQLFKWTQTELERLTKDQGALQSLFSEKWLELVKQSRESMKSLNNLLPPLVSAARDELEIPIDEASYARSLKSTLSAQETNFDAFLSQIFTSKEAESVEKKA